MTIKKGDMETQKWPINRYHENSPRNPCCCFQVTRKEYIDDFLIQTETIFMSKEDNTLGYLCFSMGGRMIIDQCIAVWKISSR